MAAAIRDPALERLDVAVRAIEVGWRARFAGVKLGAGLSRDEKQRAIDWLEAGAPVPDVAAYRRWVEQLELD